MVGKPGPAAHDSANGGTRHVAASCHISSPRAVGGRAGTGSRLRGAPTRRYMAPPACWSNVHPVSGSGPAVPCEARVAAPPNTPRDAGARARKAASQRAAGSGGPRARFAQALVCCLPAKGASKAAAAAQRTASAHSRVRWSHRLAIGTAAGLCARLRCRRTAAHCRHKNAGGMALSRCLWHLSNGDARLSTLLIALRTLSPSYVQVKRGPCPSGANPNPQHYLQTPNQHTSCARDALGTPWSYGILVVWGARNPLRSALALLERRGSRAV